ncbi:choice-of-anchor Q domain-containing protein [Ahniella affigens]|nr:choice-of-anchor Q domain-containing protein [Ahniella affigens]
MTRSLLTLAASAWFAAAQAASFCAATGDQLASALNTADSNNANDEIRVTSGVKTRTGIADGFTRWVYIEGASEGDNDLVLSGGWNAACTIQNLQVPTILDAELSGPALDVQLNSVSFAVIDLSGFDIVRGYTNISFDFSGLRVSTESTNGPAITLDRIRVRNSGSDGNSSGIVRLGSNSGSLQVRNMQVDHNRSYSGASVILAAGGTSNIRFVNSTVATNTDSVATSAGPVGGVSAFGSGTIDLYNNVLYGNTSANSVDLSLASGVGILANNHIGVLRGTPANVGGTTTGDPLLSYNASGWAVPAGGSQLRDSGSTFVPGGAGAIDARGLPRVQGVKIDRGAVEFDSMFASGFE